MPLQNFDLAAIAPRIMLVDDEASIRDILTHYLAIFGLEADQAKNGLEALKLLENQHYDLVLTDMHMPEMDGMALLQHIKEHYPTVDVLVISGYTELYNFTDLVIAGATDFIKKPFQQDELQAKLQRIFREQYLRTKLAKNKKKERTFFFHIVESLAVCLDSKDEYTHGHSRRVTNLALQLAEHAEEEEVDLELLRLCGVLHDIGKIGIPDKILGKASKLSPEEFAIIKKHPELGAKILRPMTSDQRARTISDIIRHHHERFDGKGYPDGLKGREIPYLARILAIADSFDAMTSSRPYRPAMTFAEAIEEIRGNSGTQFDPILAGKFIQFLEKSASTDPCLSLGTCVIFQKIKQDQVSAAYETQYCRSNFKDCARYKINDEQNRPANLLPDGSFFQQDATE